MSVYLLMLFSWHNTVGFIFYYVRTQKALDYLRNVYVHICTTHLFVLSCMYTRLYHAAKSLQSCPTVQPHRQQLTRPRHPWDSPGKNIEVGCHFLLQCMKAKSESEVAQSCPVLLNINSTQSLYSIISSLPFSFFLIPQLPNNLMLII